MAEDFDASPRAAKRRKNGTYGSNRTIFDSSDVSSTFSNVSHAFSKLSKRLFSRNKQQEDPAFHDDSAYASKEDSLIEDELTAKEESRGGAQEFVEEEDGYRKSAKRRKSKNEEKKVADMTDSIQNTPGQAQHISGRNHKEPNEPHRRDRFDNEVLASTTRSKNQPGKRRTETNNSSTNKFGVSLGNETPQRSRERTDGDVQVNENDHDENQNSQARTSGRERRRPRRYSNEMVLNKKILTSKRKSDSTHTQDLTEKIAQSKSRARSKEIDQSTSESSATILSPVPKGILTPSRRGPRGPRKSVVFDESEKFIEAQFGFKDITSSDEKLDNVSSIEALTPSLAEKWSEQGPRPAINPENITNPLSLPARSEPEDDLFVDQNYPDDILQTLELPTKSAGYCEVSDIEDDPHLIAIKKIILSRITGATVTPMAHLTTQLETLQTLLSATITEGESNSLLLLGSRGTGKTALIETVLSDLKAKNASDFHIVRLDGFVQTDDKLALREIWRQLGREMQVSENETNEISSYADTMASLLSLLSHPEELDDDNAINMNGVEQTAKSIVFILDEFDLFTTHPRQTLLYNLFDIAQSRKAPIAVIGCSARMDVVDCLEKRVKSRFSHRWLHVPAMKTLLTFQEAVQGTICISESGFDAVGLSKQDLQWRSRWNQYMNSTFFPSQAVQTQIRQVFYTTKSLPDILSALYTPIATLSITTSDLPSSANRTAILPTTFTGLHSLLPSLPLLHLALLIAAARLDTIHNLAALNFNLVYSHYSDLVAQSRLQRAAGGMTVGAGGGLRLWTKEIARTAWEELGEWEILVPVTRLNAGGGVAEDGGTEGSGGGAKMWRVDVTLEDIGWAVKEKLGSVGAGETLSKWCKDIMIC